LASSCRDHLPSTRQRETAIRNLAKPSDEESTRAKSVDLRYGT
jgi:hypothetical protein